MTQSQQQNVPALRFLEYSGEWEEMTLAEMTTYQKGYAFKSSDYIDNGVRIIRASDLTDSSLKNEKQICVNSSIANNCERYKIFRDEIIVTTVGSKPNLIESAVGRAIYVNSDRWGLLNQNLVNLNSRNEFSSGFIYNFLRKKRYTDYIWQLQRGNANQSNIAVKDLFAFKFLVPRFNEQKKIAAFLSAVDEKIEQLTRKRALLEQYKKGMMQKLFSQELRFKDDNGDPFPDWKDKKLYKISDIIMGTSPESKFYNNDSKGLPLIQGNADIKNRKSAPRIFTSAITKECLPEDVLLSVRAPVGEVSVSNHHACIGRGMSAIRAKGLNEQAFIYQFLLWFEPRWQRLSQGSTFESVNTGDINSLSVITPHPNEQKKIAGFLSSIDNKINLITTELTQARSFKKGLLQQMFV